MQTITIPTGALTWDQISRTYGSAFTILVYVNRNNKNKEGSLYCYGAEILVDYTPPASTNKLYLKINGTWTEIQEMYKKVNGSWALVSDPSTELNTTANYVSSD